MRASSRPAIARTRPTRRFSAISQLQKPKQFSDPAATTNAKMSAMLQYMLCASRFAHYIKVMVRDKIGGGIPEKELQCAQQFLAGRLRDRRAGQARSRSPVSLREGRVEVGRSSGAALANFRMTMHLLPHFQLDQLTVALKLATNVKPGPQA